MWKEFKEFAVKGNAIDLAVGIILGAAFGSIVTSLVEQIIMPLVGLAVGGVDFSDIFTVLKQGSPVGPYETLAAANAAGAVVMAWGAFFNTIISFLIVAFSVFLIVKWVNRLQKAVANTTSDEAAAEPALTTDQELLREIRDAIKARPTAL